ncbi:thioesterase II family protein [Streptomyces sp. NRRL F-525]|uniref:thioesterase II family protein n=1 Tax=Streptomyces sp. NRRL F-525 TaxID=1463861 RepID=UPI00131C1D2A|nr:alpha/beta fold hydrolase [Streptomyces sp. NRRL F-525]
MSGAYLPVPPDPGARLRLFCFHHAGGAASLFRDWQQALGPDISVVPVQLPGREQRVREPRFTSMEELLPELHERLGPALAGPYAFYGHSMGALLARNLAQRVVRCGGEPPVSLLVGAYPAPHRRPALAGALALGDQDLAQWLVDMGGMSPMLLGYPEWLRMAVGILRDDLQVCESHHDGQEQEARHSPLSCPIHVFTGADDALVPEQDAAAWAQHTLATATVQVVPGGHLFVRDSPAVFLDRLVAVLRETVPTPG